MAAAKSPKTAVPPDDAARLEAVLRECLHLWGLENLADEIELRTSSRMTRSLGNARPETNRITLAQWLFDQPKEIVDEVLCHEAAHLAVHRLHGRGVRPHGREWRSLVQQAGFQARTRIPLPNPPNFPPRRRRTRRSLRRRSSLLGRAAALIRG